MAETLHEGTWRWHDIMKDLEEKGNLPGVVMDPTSVSPHSCAGTYNGEAFAITWAPDRFMLLTMESHCQELVDAFAAVLEYDPFCRYLDVNGLPTVEWAKSSPDDRFGTLSDQRELVRLT